MDDSRSYARWFLGAMIALPVVAYLFSLEGLGALRFLGMPSLPLPYEAQGWVWLAMGLILALGLSAISVARWRAPSRLWWVALAGAVLQALNIARVLPVLMALGSGPHPMTTPDELVARFVSQTPFEFWPFYVAGTIGYLVAIVLGCIVGAKLRPASKEQPLGTQEPA